MAVGGPTRVAVLLAKYMVIYIVQVLSSNVLDGLTKGCFYRTRPRSRQRRACHCGDMTDCVLGQAITSKLSTKYVS